MLELISWTDNQTQTFFFFSPCKLLAGRTKREVGGTMLRRGRASDHWYCGARVTQRAGNYTSWIFGGLATPEPVGSVSALWISGSVFSHVYLQHHGAMRHWTWLPGGCLCQMQGTRSWRKPGHYKDPEQAHGAKRDASRQQRQLSHSAKEAAPGQEERRPARKELCSVELHIQDISRK